MTLTQATAAASTIAKRLWQAWVVILLLALGTKLVSGNSHRTLDMLNVLILFLAILALLPLMVLRLALWTKDRKARTRDEAERSASHNSDT